MRWLITYAYRWKQSRSPEYSYVHDIIDIHPVQWAIKAEKEWRDASYKLINYIEVPDGIEEEELKLIEDSDG